MIDSIKSKAKSLFVLAALLTSLPVSSQTIEEKKAQAVTGTEELTPEMYRHLIDVNSDLKKDQEELRRLYAEVEKLYEENKPPSEYQKLLEEINEARERVLITENSWREMAVQNGSTDAYALWHQPETTIGQLIMDYGSQDFVYLMTPEIASIKISVDSNLLIPRSSWADMLDVLLAQNGIGYNQLNPFVRQLFLLKDNRSNIKLITNNRQDLEILPPDARVSFVITPEPADVRRIWLFLEKFINPNSTSLQQIGRDIMIIGPVGEVIDLLTLHDFIATNKGDKEFKVFPVSRVDVEEMAKILAAIFDHTQGEVKTEVFFGPKERGGQPQRPKPPTSAENAPIFGLKIIPLANVARAIFLVGTKEEIHKAEQIIRQVESQVGEAREKVIFWYTAKHADPEELAEVLEKIYALMIKTGANPEGSEFPRQRAPVQLTPVPTADQIANEIVQRERDLLPVELYQTSYYQQGNYVVNPAPVEPKGTRAPRVTSDRDNFIVTPKTGSIAMVVEADILPKLKELIRKLDVPKRMVQLEALLFERRLVDQTNFGLNMLRIGDCAANINSSCLSWTTPLGILDYMLSRKESCNLPAYDFTYRFLMTQEDIQINASPSVVAVNQTPATIAIVEETSINTGIYNVETAKGVTLERAFTRAQYGITLEMTPMIHITEECDGPGDEPNYITLETDVTFDTPETLASPNERPNVTRRHINNIVSVPDGQTVILGGLRRKHIRDRKESIPFVGELPALGKFFSMRQIHEDETEMFIFITPTIISSPLEDFERIKCDEMKRRPGDIPEFLCGLYAAIERERNQVLTQSMIILLGPEPDRCYAPGYFRPSTCGNRIYKGKECFGDCYPCCGEYYGR